MRIETERLILRNFEKSDFEDLFEYLSDSDAVKYEPYKPMSREEVLQELDERIESDEMIAVILKASGKLIGNVYFGIREFETRELGYVFNKNYWGKGYAKEACTAVVNQAFGQGIHRVFAECDPDNPNSWHLLESLGFVREGYFKQNVYFWTDSDGQPIWKDTFVYSKLNKN